MSKTILSKFVIFDSIDDLCHVRVLHGKNDIAVGWGLNPSSLVQSWHRFLVASGLWRTDVEESREKERARWSVRRKGIKGQALLLTSGSAILSRRERGNLAIFSLPYTLNSSTWWDESQLDHCYTLFWIYFLSVAKKNI